MPDSPASNRIRPPYDPGLPSNPHTHDHDTLLDLSDDDHPQYHNDARADTWLATHIGVDVQAQDADLETISGLTTEAGLMVRIDSSTWTARSIAEGDGIDITNADGTAGNPTIQIDAGDGLTTSLGDLRVTSDVLRDADIGTQIQAHGDVLDDLNTLGTVASDGEFIVGVASGVFAYESGSTARESLGLGDLAVQDTINDNDWSGTDLAVTNGGTGASSASTARENLGIETVTWVVKPSNQSKTEDTTLDADDDLVLSLVSGKTYRITIDVRATADSATPDIQIRVSYSGTHSNGWWIWAANTSAASGRTLGSDDFSRPLDTNNGGFQLTAVLTTTSTGTISFDWAQANSSTDATSVLAGSLIVARELP